jgi:capsular polysaccharide biosynthesis protein
MTDYMSVIRRRKLLIAAMTLAGLALALFYSVAVAKPSYVSNSKVLVRPITSDVTPQNVDRLVIMGSERELATSDDVAQLAKERMKSDATISSLKK